MKFEVMLGRGGRKEEEPWREADLLMRIGHSSRAGPQTMAEIAEAGVTMVGMAKPKGCQLRETLQIRLTWMSCMQCSASWVNGRLWGRPQNKTAFVLDYTLRSYLSWFCCASYQLVYGRAEPHCFRCR